MAFQKTFSFDTTQCPKIHSNFWRNLDASIQVSWGECSIKEIEYESPISNEKIKVLKIVIIAETISHLAQCAYDLGEKIAEFKSKNRNFQFHTTIIPGAFEQDEEANKKLSAKTLNPPLTHNKEGAYIPKAKSLK